MSPAIKKERVKELQREVCFCEGLFPLERDDLLVVLDDYEKAIPLLEAAMKLDESPWARRDWTAMKEDVKALLEEIFNYRQAIGE